jgi:hypothetical protein
MHNRPFALAPLLATTLVGCAIQTATPVPVQSPEVLNELATGNPIVLSKVIANLPEEDLKVSTQLGAFCIPSFSNYLPANYVPMSNVAMAAGFRRTMAKFNFKVNEAAPGSVFERREIDRQTLFIGATIQRLRINVCHPFSNSTVPNATAPAFAKGSAYIQVRWEVFSVDEGKVIFTSTTEAEHRITDSVTDGVRTLVLGAFLTSLSKLAENQSFRDEASAQQIRTTRK